MITIKDLLTLTLRVTGFWLLIEAIGSVAQLVAMIYTVIDHALLAMAATYAASYSLLATAMLLYAPEISSWFYRGQTLPELRHIQINLRDVYEICARALGIYSFLAAIEPAGKIIPSFFMHGFWHGFELGTWPWAYIVQAVAYMLSGFFLVYSAPAIATVFLKTSGHQQVEDQRCSPG